MKKLIIGALLISGCSGSKLNTAAQSAIIIEKSTSGGIRTLDAWVASEKDRCIKLNLETEAQRAKCIEKAIKAVEVTEVVAAQLKQSLDTFWDIWAILKAKQENGTLSNEDWARLAQASMRILEQFEALKPYLGEIK